MRPIQAKIYSQVSINCLPGKAIEDVEKEEAEFKASKQKEKEENQKKKETKTYNYNNNTNYSKDRAPKVVTRYHNSFNEHFRKYSEDELEAKLLKVQNSKKAK